MGNSIKTISKEFLLLSFCPSGSLIFAEHGGCIFVELWLYDANFNSLELGLKNKSVVMITNYMYWYSPKSKWLDPTSWLYVTKMAQNQLKALHLIVLIFRKTIMIIFEVCPHSKLKSWQKQPQIVQRTPNGRLNLCCC